jgi:hypothetical protein
MPDNWGFVIAAYGLTALVLTLYWHHLVRKERALNAERSRGRSRPGHPRTEPISRPPLQQ